MKKDFVTIKDRSQFGKLISDYFINRNVFAKMKSGNIEVKVLLYSDGLLTLCFAGNISVNGNAIIYTRHDNNIICAQLQSCDIKEDNVYVFNPVKFQIFNAARKEDRKSFADDSSEKLIFVTNVLSGYLVEQSLNKEAPKITRIKEIIEYDNYTYYDFLKVFFIHEQPDDLRMKYFYKERKPIFIQDIRLTDAATAKQKETNEFVKNVMDKDDALKKRNKNFVAEATVPFFYDNKLPFGYIQVNSVTPFQNTVLTGVKRIAAIIEELSKKYRLFNVIENRMLVSDVSKYGLGITFKDMKMLPFYKENSYAAFDIILPMNKHASMLADVKHLDILQNKTVKVGFSIKDMDNISMYNYDNFLSEFDKKDNAAAMHV